MSEQPVSANLKEQLVAYLDGELDEQGMREVESLLSTDPRARQALRQLETAWDLLEELPRAEVDQSFTESTIEIVAVSLEKDLRDEEAARPRRQRRKWGLAAAAVLAASVLGFAAVAILSADPNEQLLHDLPLLARLDQYRQVENLKFLRELHESHVLKDVTEQSEEPTTLADRRMLVEHMTPAEKLELREKQERFTSLPSDEQQRLRSLHEQLQKDPQASQLRGEMLAYSDWLLKLSPSQRANLASADTAARVEKVKNLRAEEIRRTADRADATDLEAVAAWLQTQIYERMSPERKTAIDELRPADRRGAIMLWAMSPRAPGAPPRQPDSSPEMLAELRDHLPAATKAKLDALESDEKRRKVLTDGWGGWIPQATRDSVRKYFEALLADVPEGELVAYFEQLSDKQKEDLQKLSTEYRDHRLRLMFVLERRTDRLPEYARNLKPEMLGWLRWGRGEGRWPSAGYRGRDTGRGDGPAPSFMGTPEGPRPPRRP